MMSRLLSKITSSLALLLLLFACTEEERFIQTGSITLSDVQTNESGESTTFQDLGGRPIEISNFVGRKLIINYWKFFIFLENQLYCLHYI